MKIFFFALFFFFFFLLLTTIELQEPAKQKSLYIFSDKKDIQTKNSLSKVDQQDLQSAFGPSCKIQVVTKLFALVCCQTSVKYFEDSFGDFQLNKAGQRVVLQPQDDGYRCKAALDKQNNISLIGSLQTIKVLTFNIGTKALTKIDIQIPQSVKIIDVDIDSTKSGHIYVAYMTKKNDVVQRINVSDSTREVVDVLPRKSVSSISDSFSKLLVGLKSQKQILSYFFDSAKKNKVKMEPIKTSICAQKLKSGARFIAILCQSTRQLEVLTHIEYKSLYVQRFKFELSGFPKFLTGQFPLHQKYSEPRSLNHLIGVAGVNGQFVLLTGIQNKHFYHFAWFTFVYQEQKILDFSVALQIQGQNISIFLQMFTQAKSLNQLICNRGQQIKVDPITSEKSCSDCSGQISVELFQDCSQTCRLTSDPQIATQCDPVFCSTGASPCFTCQQYRQAFSSNFFSNQSTYSQHCHLTSCRSSPNQVQCISAAAQAYSVGTGNPICIPYSGTSCEQCTAQQGCTFYNNKLCSSLSTFDNFVFPQPIPQTCEKYVCPKATLKDFIGKINSIPVKQDCKWKFKIDEQLTLKLQWAGDGLSITKLSILNTNEQITKMYMLGADQEDAEISLQKGNQLQVYIHKFTSATILKGSLLNSDGQNQVQDQERVQGEKEEQDSEQGGIAIEAIIIIAIVSLIFVIVFIVICVIVKRKRKQKKVIPARLIITNKIPQSHRDMNSKQEVNEEE